MTAGSLINGTTITLNDASDHSELEFFHIKLARHNVIYRRNSLRDGDQRRRDRGQFCRLPSSVRISNSSRSSVRASAQLHWRPESRVCAVRSHRGVIAVRSLTSFETNWRNADRACAIIGFISRCGVDPYGPDAALALSPVTAGSDWPRELSISEMTPGKVPSRFSRPCRRLDVPPRQ